MLSKTAEHQENHSDNHWNLSYIL